MAQVNCHLIGCNKVIAVTGDGSSFSQMVGVGEARKRVFFCSVEHSRRYNAGQEPKRPGVLGALALEGTGESPE